MTQPEFSLRAAFPSPSVVILALRHLTKRRRRLASSSRPPSPSRHSGSARTPCYNIDGYEARATLAGVALGLLTRTRPELLASVKLAVDEAD